MAALCDQGMAEGLADHDLHPWRGDEPVTRVDLATEGRLAGSPTRELRPWCVFETAVRRDAAVAAAQLASFLAADDPERRVARDVVQLTLRRRDCQVMRNVVPTGGLARHHHEFTGVLGPMLSYAAARHAGRALPLSYGVHHRMLGAGGHVDLHAHATIYKERGEGGDEALAWLVRYLQRRFEVYVSPDHIHADDLDGSAAAAAYEEDGFSPPTDGTDDDRLAWLATYVRQAHVEHHLHRRMTLGPLREHVGELRLARVQPVLVRSGDGDTPTPTQSNTVNPESVAQPSTVPHASVDPPVVTYRPVRVRAARRPRPPYPTSGPTVLAARLSWLDGELRPVLLVKGWQPDRPGDSWKWLAASYYLDGLVAAARAAMPVRIGEETGIPPRREGRLAPGAVAYLEASGGMMPPACPPVGEEVVAEVVRDWERTSSPNAAWRWRGLGTPSFHG